MLMAGSHSGRYAGMCAPDPRGKLVLTELTNEQQASEGRNEQMQEIDYTLEGESADRFRKNFGNDNWLKVPRIYWERTTQEILTMEYCPGVKINRIAELDKLGVDRKRLAKLAVESYLQQILTYGFFHAGMACVCRLQ